MGCNIVGILVLARGYSLLLGVVEMFVTATGDERGGRPHAHKNRGASCARNSYFGAMSGTCGWGVMLLQFWF